IHRLFTRPEGAPSRRKAAPRGMQPPRRRRPSVEALEHRTLLSFAGSLSQVSTLYGDNGPTANASSANGPSAAAWINSTVKNPPDVYAQRYDAQGKPAGPVTVVENSTGTAWEIAVAMDASGRFVVAWQDFPSPNLSAIEMRAYSATGAPLTEVTRVATGTATNYNPLGFPSVGASNGS